MGGVNKIYYLLRYAEPPGAYGLRDLLLKASARAALICAGVYRGTV